MKDLVTAVSRGIGNEGFEPSYASVVEPELSRNDEVPIQIGFIRLGGMRARLGLLDWGYRDTMAIGIL